MYMKAFFIFLCITCCVFAIEDISFRKFAALPRENRIAVFVNKEQKISKLTLEWMNIIEKEYAELLPGVPFYCIDLADDVNEYIRPSFKYLPLIKVAILNRREEEYSGLLSEEDFKEYLDDILLAPDTSNIKVFTTKDDLYKYAKEQQKPVFVKLFAEWCGHCKKLKPIFADMSNTYDKVAYLEVECPATFRSEAFCKEMSVTGYPTLMLFNGKDWVRFKEMREMDKMVDFCENHLEWYDFEVSDMTGSVQNENGEYYEPISTEIRLAPFSEIRKPATEPRLIVFGDITEESSQNVYRLLEQLQRDRDDIPEIVRVEKKMKGNAAFFNSNSRPLPLIFLGIPGGQPELYQERKVSVPSLLDFIEDTLTEPDFSHIIEYENDAQLKDIMKQGTPIFMKHYEPWCGHCKALAPKYAQASAKYHGVVWMEVQCGKNETTKQFCKDQGVTGYPTLKLYDGKKWVNYSNARTTASLIEFAQKYGEKMDL
eukprot:gnl/Carplike_NY0171/1040_a1423_1409.p1 GENE.gnl/Carplike_NY0171/1040_a1423_1409~~gnl/Carplike_NY0171/1040_a1423_1409.p1  ORF type:complete len:493 (+),score=119.14 gnl/Carplike_NY0171/1040_a1423_1409:30-1481(+)